MAMPEPSLPQHRHNRGGVVIEAFVIAFVVALVVSVPIIFGGR